MTWTQQNLRKSNRNTGARRTRLWPSKRIDSKPHSSPACSVEDSSAASRSRRYR